MVYALIVSQRGPRMRTAISLSVGMVVMGCVAAACGGGGDEAIRRRDAGSVDGGGTPVGSCTTSAECAGETFCSVAGVCIGTGSCRMDGDCAGALRCGLGSRRCVPAGGCSIDGDCDTGMRCNASLTCEPDECGRSEFEITRLAPNVMILLDRSGSMDGTIGGRTRWDIAKDAIEMLTTRFDAEIRFGLATYSSCLSGGCSAGRVVVPVADRNATAINGFLTPLRGRGSSRGTPPDYLCDSGDPETSTGVSLDALVGEPSLADAMRGNAVLLITDGGESSDCARDVDGTEGATNLYAQTVPVRTYAVGFSADTRADQLMSIAVAGRTDTFYQADDAAALNAALEAIATSVASCDYALSTPPPDPSMMFIYFNDDPAGISTGADGWTYDAATMTLRFTGAACAQIMAGSVSDIDVIYGCPGPIFG